MNFESHADMSLEDCKQACMNSAGCEEFSYPLMDAKTGCRIAKAGGCSPQAIDNEVYAVYKKIVTQDEDPDYEGPGSRRRRRSDSRRRTHMTERTSVTGEIQQVIAESQEQAKKEAEVAVAVKEGEQEAKLYEKEAKAKNEVEKRERHWRVKQELLNPQAAEEETETPQEAVSVVHKAKAKLKEVQNVINALKSQQIEYKANLREEDRVLEVTESSKEGVLTKLQDAEKQIETMMTDPGRLADQDRQIGIAILGKLRVAGALLKGQLAGLQPEQRKVDWVVNLREAMKKALQNPSKDNLIAARAAYATGEAIRANEKKQEEASEEAQAEKMDKAEEEAQEEQDRQEEAEEEEMENKKAQAELNQAKAQEEANKQANEGNTGLVPIEAAPVPMEPLTSGPPSEVRHIARGFYDPPAE